MPDNEELSPSDPNADGTVGESINVNETVDKLASAMKLAGTPVEDKEPTGAPAPDKEGTPAAEPVTKPADQQAAPQPTAEERVPDTWKPEAQAKWATLDPTVRAEVARREKDIADYVRGTTEYVKAGQATEKIFAPFTKVFQEYKIDPWAHVNGLLHAHYNILFGQPEQKLNMLRQICRDANINPQQLFDPNAKPVERDSYVQQLEQNVRGLTQQVANLKQGVDGVQAGFQEQRVNDLQVQIYNFRSDLEAHPFFDDVMDDCTKLITSGMAPTLQKAYEMAVYSNETVRAKQLKLDTDRAAASRQAEQVTRTAAARKATGANVVSRGSGRLPAGDETIHDTVANQLKAIRARDAK